MSTHNICFLENFSLSSVFLLGSRILRLRNLIRLFSNEILIFFLFLLENICCGYSLSVSMRHCLWVTKTCFPRVFSLSGVSLMGSRIRGLKPSTIKHFSTTKILIIFLPVFLHKNIICGYSFQQQKYWYFFLFLYENICCRSSLEVPHWGTSNEDLQYMFLCMNKKDIHMDSSSFYLELSNF